MCLSVYTDCISLSKAAFFLFTPVSPSLLKLAIRHLISSVQRGQDLLESVEEN